MHAMSFAPEAVLRTTDAKALIDKRAQGAAKLRA
jgi:hypothetical protein